MVKLSLCAEWNETKHNKNQTEKNAYNKMPLHPFPDPDWSLIPYEHIMLPTACIQYLNMMLKLCIIAYVFISFARVLFGRPCVYARECVGFLLSIFLSVFSTSLRFFRQSVVCAHIVFFLLSVRGFFCGSCVAFHYWSRSIGAKDMGRSSLNK